MSILSEQSVAPSGSPSPQCEPSSIPTPSGKTVLPTQSTPELAITNSSAASGEPLSADGTLADSSASPAVEKQQQLQQLCRHASLHHGELAAAAATITQSSTKIVNADRVSLWFYTTDEHLQLVDSYDASLDTHRRGLQLSVTDYAPYFEGMVARDSLMLDTDIASHSTTQCLSQSGILLPGAFLETPVRAQGQVVGVLWCECIQPYRWTALDQASAVSIALLAATAFESKQRLSLASKLTYQHRQLKRETIEREQAEQAWQESQRFIQGIIDASTNILYVDSFADGSNFYINRWIQNVLGYTPSDVQKLGPRYLEHLVHADEKALMATERRKLSAINDGEVVENEYRFRHRQGNWRWLLCRETVFQRDEEGLPTQVFGTATDITKRKHAEVALQEFNAELARLARMDGLTQVANRRSFDEYLTQEWENVGSGRSSLSLILCDIDYFKSFNDSYGHQAGDVCLRKVAKAIERAVKRSTDLVARYGGEEFGIILPNTSATGVEQVAQEIQQAIRALAIPHKQSEISEFITLSLGIASIASTKNAHPDMLVASADQGLYQAKYDGRDRFCHGQIEYP